MSIRLELTLDPVSMRLLHSLLCKVDQMSAQLDTLTAQVARNTDVEASAITLIRGIAAQLAAAGTDPAKLTELSTSLQSSAADLAAAVAENTSSGPVDEDPNDPLV